MVTHRFAVHLVHWEDVEVLSLHGHGLRLAGMAPSQVAGLNVRSCPEHGEHGRGVRRRRHRLLLVSFGKKDEAVHIGLEGQSALERLGRARRGGRVD